jgi:hypothetical protein
MTVELDALDEPGVEKLSLSKFGTWNARDGAGDMRFGYWVIEVPCDDEKGP